uniref:Uncharacterized protein n=1 Tax=Ceratitis capitata TaxID=7213 RepID=W8C214_CERCA
MENLQGRNSAGSNGTFFKKVSDTENLKVGHCAQPLHLGTDNGVTKAFAVIQNDCNCRSSVGSSGVLCGKDNGSWLSCGQQHMNNNNNNNSATKCNVDLPTIPAVTATDASCAGIVARSDVAGGGAANEKDCCEIRTDGVVRTDFGITENNCIGLIAKVNTDAEKKLNGSSNVTVVTSSSPVGAMPVTLTASGVATTATAVTTLNDFNECSFDVFSATEAAAASAVSPSASLNNSTENLSYASDNLYGDDLLFLEGDDDANDINVDAEDISLNSDDCVYAYRGDGADFDLNLDGISGRGNCPGNICMADDETDFLEMDFEPDPLSEIEYGSVEAALGPSDAFLMQREACQLSGRHSATLGHYSNGSAAAQRLLFSSPIDDSLPPPPAKTLQSQLLLSKNFARITMHLDQIKGENGDCEAFERIQSDRASALGMADDTVDAVPNSVINAAHSLPNALFSNFGRDLLHKKEECKASPTKVTGAKPKRFSTFSTSSSTSSKNSSKSRNSLRSTYALTALSNSASFDERSASCTEFRCSAPKARVSTENCLRLDTQLVSNTATTTTTTNNDGDDFSGNDDTCLDCLEKEFLASTIGKAIDINECPRCRKRSSSSIALFKRAAQTPTGTTRCRSGSPLIFKDARDDCIFGSGLGDYLQPRNLDSASAAFRDIRMLKDDRWLGDSVSCDDSGPCASESRVKPRLRTRVRARTCDAEVLQQYQKKEESTNQRHTTTGDSCFEGNEQLLKNLLLTEKEAVTVTALNLSEELLVDALNKLHVSYNLELIKSHLHSFVSNAATTTTANTTQIPAISAIHKRMKEFKDLKHLLMHESKRHCNYPKLKLLIELATRQQVEVEFQRDANDVTAHTCVPVKVADILQQWVRTKNLSVLKHLDKRFVEANVLGKIANIIRQAQQRCAPRRPLPECILIPQFYAAGVLKLTKKT